MAARTRHLKRDGVCLQETGQVFGRVPLPRSCRLQRQRPNLIMWLSASAHPHDRCEPPINSCLGDSRTAWPPIMDVPGEVDLRRPSASRKVRINFDRVRAECSNALAWACALHQPRITSIPARSIATSRKLGALFLRPADYPQIDDHWPCQDLSEALHRSKDNGAADAYGDCPEHRSWYMPLVIRLLGRWGRHKA